MPRGNPARKITFRLQPELIARIDALADKLAAHRPQALEYALDAAEKRLERNEYARKTRRKPE